MGDLGRDGWAEQLVFEGLDLTGLDLRGVSLSECRFCRVTADGASLHGGDLSHLEAEGLQAAEMSLPESGVRHTTIRACRVGALEAWGVESRDVLVDGSRLDFVNLRGAHLVDVTWRDCHFGELDLGEAHLERVTFDGCRVDALRLGRARLERVDMRGLDTAELDGADGLRGALLSSVQVMRFAESFAHHLGVTVSD